MKVRNVLSLVLCAGIYHIRRGNGTWGYLSKPKKGWFGLTWGVILPEQVYTCCHHSAHSPLYGMMLYNYTVGGNEMGSVCIIE